MVRLADWFNESYTDPSEQIIKNKQYFEFVNKLITFQQNATFNVPYIQEYRSLHRRTKSTHSHHRRSLRQAHRIHQ